MCITLFWAGRETTPKKLAEILEILNDGQWHLLAEIRKKMKLTDSQIKQIADFLREYSFVTLDDVGHKVKINEDVRKFLSQSAIQ